jgi:site-specific recombinase XerD
MINIWAERRQKENMNGKRARLSTTSTFLKYLKEKGCCDVHVPAEAVPKNQHFNPFILSDKGPHKYLSKVQMRILLGLPTRDTASGFRDLMLISLLYDSACRIDEVLSLRLKEIRYSERLCCINVPRPT